jgi:tetratricopeptide (TPR) repeat protein
MLLDAEDNGLLQFIDRGDKIFGMVAGLASVAGLFLTIFQVRQGGAALDRRAAVLARTGHVVWARDMVEIFVDRQKECQDLRRALTDRGSRVILVLGEAGVGKTELVRRVLDKARIDHSWHHATPTYAPTVETIVGDLISVLDASRASGPHDRSPIGQLEAVLRSLGTKRHVIVFDSAERLLNADGQLTDLSLDEALDLFSTGPRHGVKVVFVTDVRPVAAGGDWLGKAYQIGVNGLPLEHFRDLVVERAGQLASLDDRTLADVHRALGGRPRLAQLFDAVVYGEEGTTAPALAATLHGWAERERSQGGRWVDRVGDRLRRRMTAAFRSDRLRVYRAVAAFATPVDAEMVAAVVDDGREPDDRLGPDAVRRELVALSQHAILADRHERLFFLPADEARRVLDWRQDDDREAVAAKRRLLANAAEALRQRRQEDVDGDWADPQACLAEVDAWLRADLPHAAFRSIEEMDADADTGRPTMLFRKARELIAERIDPVDQPANYNVLGYLHHASGDFPRATDAYRSALLGIPDESTTSKAKVYVNIAGLEWAQGYLEHAFGDFERARRLAPDDPVVTAESLAGMARCRRREGRFTEASALLTKALRVAGPHPGRMVPIAVRLVRLYVESGELREAESLVERIRESVERNDDRSLRAAYLDAVADLRLAQGRLGEAMRASRKAVRLALPAHDPVTALQARSTLSAIWLHYGNFPFAAREATAARRYSGTDLLIVIALQAVSLRRAKCLADARQAVDDLLAQAEVRTARYQRDFAAWIFRGMALCARALDAGTGSMTPAVAAFERVRHPLAEPAPTLIRQMLFLLETMALDDTERRRLRPAVNELERGLAQRSTSDGTAANG